MATLQLYFGGAPAEEAFYQRLSLVEVEENVEMPSACQLTLAVGTDKNGDLTGVSDSRLGPLKELAVVVSADGETSHCIFDGVVLSHKLHLDAGSVCSTLKVWGQDASWAMNLEEKVHEWVDVTDA